MDYVRVFQQNTLDVPQEVEQFSWNAFPNPSHTELNIRVDESGVGALVEVVDLLGRIVDQFTLQSTLHSINIHAWKAGIYFVRTRGDARTKALKIVKE